MSVTLSLKQASEMTKAVRSFIKSYPFDPSRKVTVVIEDDKVIYRCEMDRGDLIDYDTSIAHWSGKSYRKVEKFSVRKFKSVEAAHKHINEMIAYTKDFNAARWTKWNNYKPWDGCSCQICVSYRETGKLPTAV